MSSSSLQGYCPDISTRNKAISVPSADKEGSVNKDFARTEAGDFSSMLWLKAEVWSKRTQAKNETGSSFFITSATDKIKTFQKQTGEPDNSGYNLTLNIGNSLLKDNTRDQVFYASEDKG
jgi:hypothetical protein